MILHISERPDIECFEPRESAGIPERIVWGVDEAHLRNYLLPRECPRVTFSGCETTTSADRLQFLADGPAVVAIEDGWLNRARATTLYCYHFPPNLFTCRHAGAGYFVSRTVVHPVRVETIAHPLETLAAHHGTLRVVPDLWPLHDAVVASSLQYSMIRMRNARARLL